MGKQRFRDLYSTTTDRKTHNIIHIKCVTGCCIKCAIRGRQKWYHIWHGKKQSSYPNWKLVSKNKKQWMKKPLIFENKKTHHFNVNYINITW
jgi:hypothetical protein